MYFFSPYNYSYRQPMSYHYLRQPYHVKGENINERTYRALNYQTNDAQQAGYVPNAQFSKVGANVHWDKPFQMSNVRSEEMLEDKLIALKAWRMAYQEISKAVESPEQQAKVRFNGMVDDKFVFDGIWWHGHGIMNGGPLGDNAALAATLTVGKYYNAYTDGAARKNIFSSNKRTRRSRCLFQIKYLPLCRRYSNSLKNAILHFLRKQ